MNVKENDIEGRIKWFNNEIEIIQKNFSKWLKELGYKTDVIQNRVTINEKISGLYESKEFIFKIFKIDEILELKLVPYGIWLIASSGRVDIKGPSGIEKIVYLNKGGPQLTKGIQDGKDIKKSSQKLYPNIKSDDWYWYDDSSNNRKMERFSKEIISSLMERLQ